MHGRASSRCVFATENAGGRRPSVLPREGEVSARSADGGGGLHDVGAAAPPVAGFRRRHPPLAGRDVGTAFQLTASRSIAALASRCSASNENLPCKGWRQYRPAFEVWDRFFRGCWPRLEARLGTRVFAQARELVVLGQLPTDVQPRRPGATADLTSCTASIKSSYTRRAQIAVERLAAKARMGASTTGGGCSM